MGPDYGDGHGIDRVHGHPPPATDWDASAAQAHGTDRELSNATPTPTFVNGTGGYGNQQARTPASPSLSTGVRDPDSDSRRSGERNRSRPRTNRSASGQVRICKKCGEPLTGQFVRALDGTFHLDCFKCRVSTSSPLLGSPLMNTTAATTTAMTTASDSGQNKPQKSPSSSTFPSLAIFLLRHFLLPLLRHC